jgi:hypothetical protein
MFSEFRGRARELGLFASVDFSEIDAFPGRDHKDVRNMREHVVEYLKGKDWIATAGLSKRMTSRLTRVRS